MRPNPASAVVLLPGFHPPEWTAQFVAAVWGDRPPPLAIFPAHRQPVYAPDCVMAWLQEQWTGLAMADPTGVMDPKWGDRQITLIGFSAGAVGVWGLVRQWERAIQAQAVAGRSSPPVQRGSLPPGSLPPGSLPHGNWPPIPYTISRALLIDGWGVPISTQIPCYRLSHDRFTHHTSAWLGAGMAGFYADPPVAHGDLWRSPDQVWGWVAGRSGDRISAAAYVRGL